MLGFILNDPASEITATVLCGYGAYLTAEVLGASGVLSMVGAHAYLCLYATQVSIRMQSPISTHHPHSRDASAHLSYDSIDDRHTNK